MSAAPPADPRDVLRRALIEIRGLKEKLAAAEGSTGAEPIAVVGMGCRFAGGIDSPAAFWDALIAGRDGIGARPADRWASSGDAPPLPGGFLADVEGFDARFFEIAPREAGAMDPQHRLLLEVTWEALEHAAIDPHGLAGSRTGVFIGLATNDYARRVPADGLDRYFGVGTSPAVASGRIAYLFDLRGPCLTLDTACSSSLVAVHYAMKALRDRECDAALAGGVSLMLGPELGESFAASGMLAPDGRCKTFDSRADGYGRGEGAGIVVLRRLSDAERDGDRILAVLRGSAINQDGRSAGLTAPNGPAQTALIKTALASAGFAPDDIDYVEAHGTGTPLGDPIEWHALAAAFAGRTRPLRIGAAKTNIGHTEAASGVAGLIKTVLALGADLIPGSLHFGKRNPAISAGATPLEVVTTPVSGIRRAGVSAFGFSGTNAHIVVEAPKPTAPVPTENCDVLFLSAQDPQALRALAARYAVAFAAGLDFAAACHTAAVGRAKMPWWIAVRSPADLSAAEPSNGPPPAIPAGKGPRIALPTYPFQRERFPLPGAAAAERLLTADDSLLADTDGLAHLGVLLSLIGENAALAELTFPAPLAVSTPRSVRIVRNGKTFAIESKTEADAEWTVHLGATETGSTSSVRVPSLPKPSADAASLYEQIAAHGFRYGDAARCLETFTVSGDVAAGALKAVDGPGIIEAAAQLAYALLPDAGTPVMLSGAQRLMRMTGGRPAMAWLQRTGSTADGGLRADLGVIDDQGASLLSIEGATFSPLPNPARRWSRVVAWHEIPTPVAISDATTVVWQAPTGTAPELCAALLDRVASLGSGRLRIVTRGAQATGGEASPPDLSQAAIWGMAQAIIAERPALRCRLIDLDPDISIDQQQAALAAEVLADDEPAIALRGGRRLARRLEVATPVLPAQDVATLSQPGSVVWKKRPATVVGPGMVRIDVVAAGLTFRDRLLFNGMAPQGSGLGCDCAGVVADVGAGVTAFAIGDRVVALADAPIADSVTVSVDQVAPAPTADLFDAATMPVPYLTALAGLGRLGSEDCVLIHQAASATGLAAMAVVRRAGARMVVTASRKRHAWFTQQGIDRVLDSRDPKSWRGDLSAVTVAFGSFDPSTLAQLQGIRTINLSKQAAEHFDLDKVPVVEKRRLLGELAHLPPLPRRVVPRAMLATALGDEGPMAGRTIVQLREPPAASIEKGATYIVTGAAGALGRLVTGWLAQAGAIVCHVDRRTITVAQPHFAIEADAADEPTMAAMLHRIAESGSPLRGVFHCAAIVDDDRLEQQTAARLSAVLAAKIDGAMVLDRLTRSARLDHFVLFSSIVSLLPSARQAGYAAANAVLDQLALSRRRSGLPGLSLNWGPWNAGIGRAMGVRAAEAWQGHGITPILPAMGLRALPSLLAAPEAQRIVVDRVWEQAHAEVAPVIDATKIASAGNAGPPSVERLQEILAKLLGVRDPASLDPDTPLMSFGLDSLIAVEFARALSREYARPVAPDFAFSHPTLTDAVVGLAPRRQVVSTPVRAALLAPRWTSLAASSAAPGAWTVTGKSALGGALRAALPGGGDSANLVDLSALDVDASGDAHSRDAFFPQLLSRLATRPEAKAQIILVAPAEGPLAGAIEGFATGLAGEYPNWRVRSVRCDASLEQPDVVAALLRELATEDGEARVRIGRQGRQGVRLIDVGAGGSWRADPAATYLVTGGSGGIGALVAAHLVSLGARRLVLASRKPSLPPALANTTANIVLRQVDFEQPDQIRQLMGELRADGSKLAGIFHTAGITANGAIADADWPRLGRSFPAKADGAAVLDMLSRDFSLTDFVLFSSATAWFGLARTSGYAAANGFLDGIVERRRTAGLPGQSIAWCAWQGTGMAADPLMWQDGRVPSLPPHMALQALDAALSSGEAVTTVIDSRWRSTSTSRLLERPGLAVSEE